MEHEPYAFGHHASHNLYSIHNNTHLYFYCFQLKLWDLKTCGLVHNLVGHNQAVFCVDMDDEATMVISGSADRVSSIM